MQEYVEILKAELDASKKREKARKVMNYILSCTFPFKNCHLRNDRETGTEMCPAIVSGLLWTGQLPIGQFFPLSFVKVPEFFAKVN